MPDKMPNVENMTPTEFLFAMDEQLRKEAKPLDDFTPEEMRQHRIDLAVALMPHDSTITRADIEKVIDSGRG